MIEYNLLGSERYEELSEIFQSYGTDVPDPELSRIAVAEEEGKIVGFHVLQLVPHCEPIWIHKNYREEVEWRKMWEQLEGIRSGDPVYAFSDSEVVEGMLEKAGFRESGYKVWIKVGE